MNYILTYYPWITQHVPAEEIRKNIEIFALALQEEIKPHTIKVAPVLEVPDQINSIVNGQSHIALMNPLGFAYARNQNNAIDAAAVALRIIDGHVGDSYYSQIYVHKDTGISNISGLKEHTIGYGNTQSTSNFIIPAFDLKNAHIHPFASFTRIEFTGGHDKGALAVYNKRVDAGAGHDGAIIDLANQPGYEDAKDKLIPIHRSAPIPSDPIALLVDDPAEYALLQTALVEVSEKSQAKEAIAAFWGNAQGLKATSYQPYNYLLNAVTKLGLTLEDIFG